MSIITDGMVRKSGVNRWDYRLLWAITLPVCAVAVALGRLLPAPVFRAPGHTTRRGFVRDVVTMTNTILPYAFMR